MVYLSSPCLNHCLGAELHIYNWIYLLNHRSYSCRPSAHPLRSHLHSHKCKFNTFIGRNFTKVKVFTFLPLWIERAHLWGCSDQVVNWLQSVIVITDCTCCIVFKGGRGYIFLYTSTLHLSWYFCKWKSTCLWILFLLVYIQNRGVWIFPISTNFKFHLQVLILYSTKLSNKSTSSCILQHTAWYLIVF